MLSKSVEIASEANTTRLWQFGCEPILILEKKRSRQSRMHGIAELGENMFAMVG
jgi:hypothetical protein